MKDLIKTIKDFKIIPNNFKSSGAFNFLGVENNKIIAQLVLMDEKELKDYQVGTNVEVFGVNPQGLIYFETKIVKKDNYNIELDLTEDYSVIQRREYSRVGINQGKVIFKDISPDNVLYIEDISAGGLKFISKEPLEIDKHYDIEIKLSNNMKINCALAPIRVNKTTYENQESYSISGKFIDLENADRIVLVQYAFKIKLEEQSNNE